MISFQFKHPNHAMCAAALQLLLISALVTANFDVAFARNDVRTYRCTAKEGVSILEDGTLDKMIGTIAQKHFDKVVIEIPTGHVTFPSEGTRAEWIVEQTSADKNDYILYPKVSRRL